MIDFPGSEGDSRKLKKVQELVQHFCEQCRHYCVANKTRYNL